MTATLSGTQEARTPHPQVRIVVKAPVLLLEKFLGQGMGGMVTLDVLVAPEPSPTCADHPEHSSPSPEQLPTPPTRIR